MPLKRNHGEDCWEGHSSHEKGKNEIFEIQKSEKIKKVKQMDRKKELLAVIENDPTLIPLVDEVVFLETQLIELKKLPFIKVNPKNPAQQKSTAAQKQYKELLQQYTNIIRMLIRATGTDESDEESPLRKWVKNHMNGGEG